MKKQVRLGVFETNSSSTHSVSVVASFDFEKWQKGEFVAKRTERQENENETWGNFWSYLQDWSFAHTEDAEELNRFIFANWLSEQWVTLENYKTENEPVTSPTHARWSQKVYDEWRKKLSKMSFEQITAVDKFYNGMYLTYEEYKEALRNSDCNSPFLHEDLEKEVVVFGTYYHS